MGVTLRKLASDATLAERAGAKAARLARLLAAGFPVPPGFVVLPGAAVPDSAMGLSPPLVVRSSSNLEDTAGGAAPGLFESVRDVRVDALGAAVARVRESATTAAVSAYAESRGVDTASLSMAVLVQRQVVPQTARGTVYIADDIAAIEEHRDGLAFEPADAGFSLSQDMCDALVELCERVRLEAELETADIEWVASNEQLWIVQVRPIAAPFRARPGLSPAAMAFSTEQPKRVWRLDIGHNPDPLSPAQIALVDIVRDLAPYSMRVVDGYLYTAEKPPGATGREPGATGAAEIDVETLWTVWERCKAQIEAALSPVEAQPAPAIAAAIGAYRRVFEVYAQTLTPAVERAKRALRSDRGERVAPPDATMDWGPHLGALSAAWDVAAATFGEIGADAPSAKPHARPDTLSTAIAIISNSDDVLFYRAQTVVRRSMLSVARSWNLDPIDDIFYYPFVAKLRARRLRQRELSPPLALCNGRAIRAVDTGAKGVWTGKGGGGAARGRVVRVGDFGAIDDGVRGAIVVARALTPAMIALLEGVAAIVCEHGGQLDHAAAMARELGVPYVVGCVGPWQDLANEDIAVVDGDSGVVVQVEEAEG